MIWNSQPLDRGLSPFTHSLIQSSVVYPVHLYKLIQTEIEPAHSKDWRNHTITRNYVAFHKSNLRLINVRVSELKSAGT